MGLVGAERCESILCDADVVDCTLLGGEFFALSGAVGLIGLVEVVDILDSGVFVERAGAGEGDGSAVLEGTSSPCSVDVRLDRSVFFFTESEEFDSSCICSLVTYFRRRELLERHSPR